MQIASFFGDALLQFCFVLFLSIYETVQEMQAK